MNFGKYSYRSAVKIWSYSVTKEDIMVWFEKNIRIWWDIFYNSDTFNSLKLQIRFDEKVMYSNILLNS